MGVSNTIHFLCRRARLFPHSCALYFWVTYQRVNIEVIFMILAWKILGAIAIITLLLVVFVALFDSEDGKQETKKDDKHE